MIYEYFSQEKHFMPFSFFVAISSVSSMTSVAVINLWKFLISRNQFLAQIARNSQQFEEFIPDNFFEMIPFGFGFFL